jgi:glycosyltransferase involved in cell wall biosynthesis
MAEVVQDADAGVLVDPGSPASIAAGIRSLLEASPADRAALRERVLRAAHERYTWEAQEGTLLGLYRGLLGDGAAAGAR